VQAYLNLIQQLLNCPQGEEGKILQANAELVDGGLARVMEQVAAQIAENGDENTAQWLSNLSRQLVARLGNPSTSSTPEAYFNFLMETLQKISENPNPQLIYPFWAQNLDKLDENLAQILDSWARETLTQVTPEQSYSYALDIGNFSNLIEHFPLGNIAANKEMAIAGYEIVLTIFTFDTFPQKWASTQGNLGNAYSDRIKSNRAENLETAIACYQEALKVYTFDDFLQHWAMTQNNLGNAYRNRIRGERAENLEKAISYYQEALKVFTFEQFPQDWAMTEYNLANACSDRIKGDKAENLEKAIAGFTEALKVYTFDAFPQDWANTQNSLGVAYRNRIRGDKAENLEKAITAYTEAIKVRTFDDFPQDWADTKSNLAVAYSYRIRGERAENLERAISYYQEALKVFTFEQFPQKWAGTQSSLGEAYRNRIRGERAENLEKAISYYQEALKVFTFEQFPQDWAATQDNLANAYSNRIRGDKAENLEKAISYYKNALQVRTFEAWPQKWADTTNNLCVAYRNKIKGNKAENIEMAITCYKEILKVFTFDAFPYEWARTQNNLGEAYRNRIRCDKAENLERAITCYKAALQVRTRKEFPQDYAGTLFNLGLAYQTLPQLPEAYRSFAEAIDTVEFLRGEIRFGSANEEDKRKLAEEYNQSYLCMVKVCLQLKEDCQAIEYVERSKTRNLVESLTNRTLYPEGEIPSEVRQQLRQLQQAIEEEKCRLSAETSPDYSHLNDLRQQYNQLYPEIPLSFAQIPPLLDEGTAIIEWYLFDDCFRAFLITRDSTQPQVWTSTAEDLEALVNWVNEYLAGYREFQEGKETLMSRLEQLAAILHINELISLLPPHIDQLVLIPHRYLHLLPLHALPIKSNTEGASVTEGAGSFAPLLDKFPKGVRYIPSCQLLQKVQERQRPDFSRLLGIETPTRDLYDDSPEKVYQADWGAVTAIKKQFTHPQTEIIRKEKATKSAILDYPDKLQAANCLLFFCHGKFNWDSPLDSGLSLANDELLTLEEIIGKFNLKNCRLVTLSACETGAIDIGNNSDEYIGLPFGFLLAGSTNVVASLWSVSATATALLMAKFYQELQQPQANITVALKTAQNWLRQTTVAGFREWLSHSQFSIASQEQLKIKHLNKIEEEKGATYQPFSNPYYWAAFCVIGKGV